MRSFSSEANGYVELEATAEGYQKTQEQSPAHERTYSATLNNATIVNENSNNTYSSVIPSGGYSKKKLWMFSITGNGADPAVRVQVSYDGVTNWFDLLDTSGNVVVLWTGAVGATASTGAISFECSVPFMRLAYQNTDVSVDAAVTDWIYMES
jgi:hypothetical protein